MYIGRQTARRDIRNYEVGRPDPGPDTDLQRQLDRIVTLVEEAVRSGAVDADRADELQDATEKVIDAAARPKDARFLRALDYLKHLSTAATATAGIAEATNTVVQTVSGM